MPQPRNIFILLVVIILAACSHTTPCGRIETLLATADSLMEGSPDSALTMLKNIAPDIAKLPKDIAMRHALLTAKAQNKAYVAFTTDSVMLGVADYYDSHGTANESMMAHYLLGCAYRDLHEAPVALACYYDALEKADTLSCDCDYTTMMSIWGQIAEVYSDQLMPFERIKAYEKYIWYAKRANNVYQQIHGVEMQTQSYELLKDTDKILETVEQAYSLFMTKGMTKEANSVLSPKIAILIDRNELTKAHDLMLKYENDAGLFDEYKNIEQGREYYYIVKGNYFYATDQKDSAKFYYDKAISTGIKVEAYEKKMKICREAGLLDSATMYFDSYVKATNQQLYNLNILASSQSKAMYDYTRQQRIANQRLVELDRMKNVIFAICLVGLLVMAIMYKLYSGYKQQKHKEMRILSQKILDTSIAYERAKSDVELINQNYSILQKRKEQEMMELEQENSELQKSLNAIQKNCQADIMKLDEIVKSFQEALSTPKSLLKPISKQEWRTIISLFKKVYSDLYDSLSVGNRLTPLELQCTILTRLGFHSSDIAILLDKTPQRITNLKTSVNKKMFAQCGTKDFASRLSQFDAQDLKS